MKRFLLGTMILAAACGRKTAESPMAGMTAEEHARMMAGGTQGAVDSAGRITRQQVRLTPEQERALGVVYTTVGRKQVTRTIRTVGQIQAEEPRVAEITPKVEGFVEELLVTATGDPVRVGQPLIRLYSPPMVAAQEELLTAHRLAAALDSSAGEAWRSANAMVEAARRRLAWWDLPAEDIAALERSGTVQRTVTLRSPVGGVVLEKMVVQGQRVMPGMLLYRVADLSEVWVEGEVFEQDLRFIHSGGEVHIEVSAYPGEHLMGRVNFVYPTVDSMSRTNRVRVALANPGLRLKPGMFATLYVDVSLGDALMVPRDAVIVTGDRNVVFVREAGGTLVPRDVVLGARAEGEVEILQGLTVGETIVASANFLIDAESQLAGTSRTMPGMQHGPRDTGAKSVARPAPMPEHKHD